jgi:hypothetical protein
VWIYSHATKIQHQIDEQLSTEFGRPLCRVQTPIVPGDCRCCCCAVELQVLTLSQHCERMCWRASVSAADTCVSGQIGMTPIACRHRAAPKWMEVLLPSLFFLIERLLARSLKETHQSLVHHPDLVALQIYSQPTLQAITVGIDRRFLLGSTVDSCWDRPSALRRARTLNLTQQTEEEEDEQ